LFICVGFIPSTVGIKKKKTNITTIGSRGYIQSLIDNASDGDIIYIPSGTYYENIIINKSISLVVEDKNTTIIDGGWNKDAVTIISDWVNISGFTIQHGYDSGIKIFFNHTTIIGNNISYNEHGITLDKSSNNTITGNNIIYNLGEWYFSGGIQIKYSCNNTIMGNNISDNDYGYGISFYDSSNNIMKNNLINNNIYSFGVVGEDLNDFYHDIDTTNTINGKPIYYLVEQSNLIIDDSISVGYVALVSCKNISVKNLIFANEIQGVLLVNTTYSTIKNLNLSNNRQYDIELYYSLNNNIIECQIYNGISLYKSSYNIINCNNITSTGYYWRYIGTGIFLNNSSDNRIIGNNIEKKDNGILLGSSYSNTISLNSLTHNWQGLNIFESINNTITGNDISSSPDLANGHLPNSEADARVSPHRISGQLPAWRVDRWVAASPYWRYSFAIDRATRRC